MATAKSMRIDPIAIQSQKSIGKPRAASSTFNDIMGVAGALAPLAGELTYQASGSTNAAAVLHSAFSTLPTAFGARGAGMGGMGDPGMMGSARYGSYGSMDMSGGAMPGMEGVDQAQMLDQMNQNNLQLLELQAIMQNNMQQWTTKSNLLKSTHDAKMAMIQHFAVRG
ncbi:MAG: hypothetical protein HY696_01485 [Deltaproteobacteria bacterium]|nr:hypothetical protein [Deltaproteobacteria bacterium]